MLEKHLDVKRETLRESSGAAAVEIMNAYLTFLSSVAFLDVRTYGRIYLVGL